MPGQIVKIYYSHNAFERIRADYCDARFDNDGNCISLAIDSKVYTDDERSNISSVVIYPDGDEMHEAVARNMAYERNSALAKAPRKSMGGHPHHR